MMTIFPSDYLGFFASTALFGLVPYLCIILFLHAGLALLRPLLGLRFPSVLHYYVLPFSCLGVITGMLTGASRSSVIGSLTPALLTFTSGMAVYYLGKDANPVWRRIIPVGIVMMMTATMLGSAFGAATRRGAERHERELDLEKIRFEKFELPLKLELERRRLGLTPGPASPSPEKQKAP